MRERTFTLDRIKTSFIWNQFGEQTRIAAIVGIRLARFSHYIHGRREMPESLLIKLCQATDRRPSDFLDNPAEKIIADKAFNS